MANSQEHGALALTPRFSRAVDYARQIHVGYRKGSTVPYMAHLLGVASLVMGESGHVPFPVTEEMVIAALLHDAVEDHPAELAGGQADQQAALAVLATEFGPRVAGLVGAVTNPPYAKDRDEHEQYREHVADSLRDNPWARVIKASDFTDNGAGLIHTTGPRLRRLADKYAPLVPVLRDLIARPDTPLDAPVKQHILAQIDRAADRFAAVQGDTGRGDAG